MKNQGISLISLIITIIVIIILAAIVIFTGLGTPDSANFAKFCQDVDNVQSVVLNSFSDLKVKYATQNQTRTNEQIYMEIASGTNTSQYDHMQYANDSFTSVTTSPAGGFKATPSGDACQHIKPGNTKLNGYKLPEVRQSDNGWYVTPNGQVFNATGYSYKVDGQDYTYFTANARAKAKLNANKTTFVDRAKTIATAINAGNSVDNLAISQ